MGREKSDAASNYPPSASLQLDWIAIADKAYRGMFAVAVRFQNQDQFWIPHQKLHRACNLDFSEKSQNELVWQFSMFLAILVQESIVVRLYQILAILSIACVKLVHVNSFSNSFEKSSVCTVFCLYLVFRSRLFEVN